MRRPIYAIWYGLAVTLLCGGFLDSLAQGQTSPPTEPYKAFQGNWKCASLQFDAKEQLPPEERNKLALVIKDREYRMYSLSNPEKQLYTRLFTAELTLDHTGRQFELVIADGAQKGKKVHGIYEWTGTSFRICYGPAERPRPTKFETTPNSGFFLETWQPEKR